MGRRANSGLRSLVLSLSLNCFTDQKWISDIQGKSGIPLLPETDKLDASDHSPPLVGIACNMSRQQDAPKHRSRSLIFLISLRSLEGAKPASLPKQGANPR
uniref:Uncharacterized protein n=1 Tax=Oryza nivara TaxID=4536 RepID=A0A0E0H202_ORYNI